MYKYSEFFENEVQKQKFVLDCEDNFTLYLKKIGDLILNTENLKILTVTGPTCSGKTTTAKTIIKHLSGAGKRIKIISIDDYFYGKAVLWERALKNDTEFDMDSPSSIDLELLRENIEAIYNGRVFMMPVFDFVESKRCGYSLIDPKEYDIFLLEGIQTSYPEVRSLLFPDTFKGVYTSVADDIEVNGKYFSNREIRFIRRLVRDNNFRNSPPASTFDYWQTVENNEIKNIDPYSSIADIKINSFMAYEPFMIKNSAVNLLKQIEKVSRHYEKAQNLIERFSALPDISSDYLPEISIYREFLGG